MNRRDFASVLGAGLLAAAATPRRAFAASAPRVAITMDDFRLRGLDDTAAEKRNQAILAAFRTHSVKAAIFVTGANVDSPVGERLLKQWNDAGHIIANHTWSHGYYPGSDFAKYTADILRCEELIKKHRQFRRLFRFPYLKEGDTAEERDRMRAFLAEHGYRNGAVTIDASDWYVDDRLNKRLTGTPGADTIGYRDFYLQHIRDRSDFYDGVSRRELGRSVRHTLLVHHNELNARYLGDVLDQYQRRGWKLIDAEDAYADPVFDKHPEPLPAGDSIVTALAVQTGKFKRPRWPSEDGVYEAPEMDRLKL